MNLKNFLIQLKQSPESVDFDETISLIDSLYKHTEVNFRVGETLSQAGQNIGSSKILGFALLQQLDALSTLACFGNYYRDVLANPEGEDHQNIRQFMKHEWEGVKFDQPSLSPLNFSSATIGFGL